MGVTIHYWGKLDKLNKMNELVSVLKDFAINGGWKYHLIDINANPPLKGISLQIHPEAESMLVTFDNTGELKLFYNYTGPDGTTLVGELNPLMVKTQFAGVETHITIIKLLQFIKKNYISNLEVEDEGEYWDTGDSERLNKKLDFLNMAIDMMKQSIESAPQLKGISDPMKLADELEKMFVKIHNKIKDQRPE